MPNQLWARFNGTMNHELALDYVRSFSLSVSCLPYPDRVCCAQTVVIVIDEKEFK